MTDPISMYGRLTRLDAGVRSGQSDRASESADASSGTAGGTGALVSAAPARDEFVLSETARSALQADTFDRSKVEAIKQALRDGNYPLDSRRIAESFVAIERLIDA
jgi:negative regulator of flagellin synthesis FlgM